MALPVKTRFLDGALRTVMYTKRFALWLSEVEISMIILCLQAYLEFFVSSELLSKLLPQVERDSQVTYYAINKRGDLKTNTHSEGPNAVTWGVFPGKEVVQPTIVEAVSFMAWKASASHSPPGES